MHRMLNAVWTNRYLPMGLNTPVCDIYYEQGEYICQTGLFQDSFAYKIKIDFYSDSAAQGYAT